MKAIIPAAGLGTRFLPETKVEPKELLLLVDRPVIQHIVEEALAAGVDGVVIVNSRSKQAINEHFSPDSELVELLRRRGKEALAAMVEHAGSLPVSFAYQDEPAGLGDAIHCAAQQVGGEPFIVSLGDVVLPDSAVLKRMVELSQEHDGASVIAVVPVPRDEVDRFGVIDGVDLGQGVYRINHMVEKPAVDEAPSNLAIFGRYVLSPAVMEALGHAKPGKGGEIQLTDSLEEVLAKEEMYALVIDPEQGFDTGTPLSWLESNVALALRDPKLGPPLESYLKGLLEK